MPTVNDLRDGSAAQQTATSPNDARVRDTKRRKNKRVRAFAPWMWLLPTLLPVVGLAAYPMLTALWLSLTRWNLTRSSDAPVFVAFQNYMDAFSDSVFGTAVVNTLTISISALVLEFAAGLGLALMLYSRQHGKRRERMLIILPAMIAPVVVGLIWRYLLFPDYGAVTNLLVPLGVDVPTGLLSTHGWALASIILIDVWQWTPFVAVILLAGMESLPAGPMEAARIDGANRRQLLRHIMLPQLRPIIAVVLLLRLMDTWKTFDTVYATTRGGPDNSTLTVTYEAYRQSLQYFEVGYGAALTLLILVVVLIASRAVLARTQDV